MIQNADVNIGPASYKDLAPDELLVTSIFFTIQGEGPFAGKPALFIRLAGCNRGAKAGMGCEFCDTAFQFERGRRMSLVQIWREAVDLGIRPDGGLPMVVITGGEPMMQANLGGLIPYLFKNGFPSLQIESNGDRLLPSMWPNSVGESWPAEKAVYLIVSPKVSRAGLGQRYAYRPLKKEVWDRATALKFVISGDPASPYFSVPDWAHKFPLEVYLSPMAEYREGVKPGEIASGWDHRLIDDLKTKRNYTHAAKLAMEFGFRISIQQHLFLGLA